MTSSRISKRPLWYKLDGHKPVPTATAPSGSLDWARDMAEVEKLLSSLDRRVAYDELPGDVKVSTVFLCLDHGIREREPVLFETKAFGGTLGDDERTVRTSTWEQAEKAHAEVVAEMYRRK